MKVHLFVKFTIHTSNIFNVCVGVDVVFLSGMPRHQTMSMNKISSNMSLEIRMTPMSLIISFNRGTIRMVVNHGCVILTQFVCYSNQMVTAGAVAHSILWRHQDRLKVSNVCLYIILSHFFKNSLRTCILPGWNRSSYRFISPEDDQSTLIETSGWKPTVLFRTTPTHWR